MRNRSAYKLALSAVSPLLASMMMCFVLLSIFGRLLKSDYGIAIVQMIQLVIFALMLHLPFFRGGLEEREYAKTAGTAPDMSKGLRAGLMLSLLLYISVVLLILMKLHVMPDMVFLYKILNPQFTGILHYLIPSNSAAEVGLQQILCLVFLPLTVPVIAGFSYVLGVRSSDQKAF
jgi:hypothetical protein